MDERGRPDEDDKGILDTVRRILSEDQHRAPDSGEARHPFGPGLTHPDDDVLDLESTMMIEPTPAVPFHVEPRATASREDETGMQLVGEHAEQTTRQSLGSLRTVMREQRALTTHRGGPSIEDVVREEIRPLLREWLDQNLPALVEQLVRSEIARIIERDGA